jgi:hypothetical protein
MYYIYAYIDPRNNQPFYIGKGKGERKFDHLNENSSKKENREKYKIIHELKNCNLSPIIKELETDIENESIAYNREDYFILLYGRKGIESYGILTNKTLGGKHPPKPVWTEEKKKQHSEWNKSYWTTEQKKEHRKKLLPSIVTEEIREIISLHSIGTVAVTDIFGNSKRISKSEYDDIDKTGKINTWKYVSVSSKESKRRKQLKHP